MWKIWENEACRLLALCKNLEKPLGSVVEIATKDDVAEHRANKMGDEFVRPETMLDRLQKCRSSKCNHLRPYPGQAEEPPCARKK